MNYIADACALLAYFGSGTREMTPAGFMAIRAPSAISPVTVWELTNKARLGKLPPLPLERGSFVGYLVACGFRLEKLEADDAELASALPPFHKDPMDRLLIATARRARLCIVTCDPMFLEYGVNTVW